MKTAQPVPPSAWTSVTLSRRRALKLGAQLSLLGLLTPACSGSFGLPTPLRRPERPNLLYLHSHDTGRGIAPYGHAVSTPNLSRLASEGVLFRRAFSASPTCSPSRAALLTGMMPGCNGMWGLAHRGWKLNDYSQHLVHTLKRAGYTAALAGVQHVAAGTPEACAERIGYDRLLDVKGGRAEGVAEAAARFLAHPPAQPFFLDVGFAETHVFKGHPHSPFGCAPGDPNAAVVPAPLTDTPETRQDVADYGVAVSVLDEGMGRVLDALERSGLAENTLVLCTTDHGLPLPGMKANHTDAGLGVMLLLRGPGGLSGGRVSDALVSQLDLFPTLCDLLDLEPPPWLQGTSLLPLLRGETDEVNAAVFAEHEAHAVPEPQASVRTTRFKYIRRLDGGERVRPANTDDTRTKAQWLARGWAEAPIAAEGLYDLHLDPEERTNLADAPDYAEVLRDLRRCLVVRMERWNNPLLRRYGVFEGPPGRAPV